MSTTTILSVPVAAIIVGDNDRKTFDPVALQELADSIAANGLLEPPIVRPHGDLYQLVAGERRYRAVSELLGWSEIDVKVRELSDTEAAEAMLAENFHRVDLDPIEEAGAYQKWINLFGWSTGEVAAHAHTSENRVKSRLALLSLIPDLQFLVSQGALKLTYTAGLGCLDANRQRQALRAFRDHPQITAVAFRAVCGALWQNQSQDTLFELTNEEFDAATADAIAAAVKPLSRAKALNLADRLAEALSELDPDNPLILEAVAAREADGSVAVKQSEAGKKAAFTRRNRRVA